MSVNNIIKETVLLYNLPPAVAMKVKGSCIQMGIRIRTISPDQYHIPIGMLAFGSKEQMEEYGLEENSENTFADAMLVMGGFTGNRLNQFLNQMRKNKAPTIPLKAIVTEQNAQWNSVDLHKALAEEHVAMTGKDTDIKR